MHVIVYQQIYKSEKTNQIDEFAIYIIHNETWHAAESKIRSASKNTLREKW